MIEKETRKSELSETSSQIANATGIGVSVALPIVGGALLGSYLDKVFSTTPWLTLILLITGIVLSISSLYFFLIKVGKD